MKLTADQIMRALFLIGEWNYNKRPLDAYSMAIEYTARYASSGDRERDRKGQIDWHEFSYLLDRLHSYGFLELTDYSRGGMCNYRMAGGD